MPRTVSNARNAENNSATSAVVPVAKITRIVFTALLLDILAFTIILPLFPRLLQFYRESEHGDQSSLLAWSLSQLTQFQAMIGLDDSYGTGEGSIKRPPKMDIVLLGGALGSLFSVLQFVASPIIGKLVIGGLSEGNVQLSIAMISDITTPATRSRGLAMVGIAFAIAFTVGPALGAYFANKDLVAAFPGLAQYGLHPFSGSALLAMVLLTVESLYLYVMLPETNSESWRLAVQQTLEDERKQKAQEAKLSTTPKDSTTTHAAVIMSPEEIVRLQNTYLSRLSFAHFAHLFLFSGMEFTLTFLTFHLFDFSHMQQGALLGYIGILSSLIQGGYVRRRANKVGEKRMVLQGMIAAAIGLGCIALVSSGGSADSSSTFDFKLDSSVFRSVIMWFDAQNWSRKSRMWGLYAGATGLAVTSATVVNCLTSLASLVCDMGSDDPTANSDGTTNKEPGTQSIGKGLALGRFRSWGQLGRAAGPIAACSLYWRVGPLICYAAASVAVTGVAILARGILPEVRKLPIRTRAVVSGSAATKKTQ
ncbi:hypothetical protein BGZ79_009819 [Entomortierella chlamydospora]|nr:hypothetical protein BGZ79_009819 [Entomortierella chlamydospora]